MARITTKKTTNEKPRSLPVSEWPQPDRLAWEAACRPGSRLKPGGAAAYLAAVSREDFARRYGAFLGFLQRSCRLDLSAAAATQVTPANVHQYLDELQARVRSVTVWNCIYKLRRAAELIAIALDFSWLREIENDLALVAVPRSKYDRLVLADRLVEAGLTLMTEAQEFGSDDLVRARTMRNGLMVAILAFNPMRLKNFAALEIGVTFKEVGGKWWVSLPSRSTKTHRPDERALPRLLTPYINHYLTRSRAILLGSPPPTAMLWISSTTGRPMTWKNIGTLISKTTRETIGVDVSPHLFRTAAASTAAIYGGNTPHLASAILSHHDPRVTEEHYNRSTSLSASATYAEIVNSFLLE
jgi:integrase